MENLKITKKKIGSKYYLKAENTDYISELDCWFNYGKKFSFKFKNKRFTADANFEIKKIFLEQVQEDIKTKQGA